MKKTLFVVFTSALLLGCSSPLNKKYSEKTIQEDVIELQKELDSLEVKIIFGSIIRLGLAQKNLTTMTYGEILKDGKSWKAEQDKIDAEEKALQKKVASEEAKKISKLKNAVLVTCIKKGYVEVEYQDYITYSFAIKNKSNKDIRAVKGDIVFTDLFDEKIKNFSFTYDQTVKAGTSAIWEATTTYNQFMDDDVRLKSKELKDIKLVWKPIKIIFSDGTTLE
jgi:hypothetical protein